MWPGRKPVALPSASTWVQSSYTLETPTSAGTPWPWSPRSYASALVALTLAAEMAPVKRAWPVEAVEKPSRPLSDACSAFSVALKAVLGAMETTPFASARSLGVGRSAVAGS